MRNYRREYLEPHAPFTVFIGTNVFFCCFRCSVFFLVMFCLFCLSLLIEFINEICYRCLFFFSSSATPHYSTWEKIFSCNKTKKRNTDAHSHIDFNTHMYLYTHICFSIYLPYLLISFLSWHFGLTNFFTPFPLYVYFTLIYFFYLYPSMLLLFFAKKKRS